jgi:hypothetical protein
MYVWLIEIGLSKYGLLDDDIEICAEKIEEYKCIEF